MCTTRIYRLLRVMFLTGLASIAGENLVNAQDDVSFARRDFRVGDGPHSVTVGDFNGDARSDLATANAISDNVSILLGNGDGTFRSAPDVTVGDYPSSVTVGDFNADGRVDLAVASFNGCYETFCEPGTVSILLGRGDGTFREAQDFEVGVAPESITVGDFNRDGRPDPAIADITSDTLSILIGRGDGTFEEAQDFGVGDRPFGITVGDFNADGRPDLAVANFQSNTVSILLNTSSRVVNNFVSFASLPSTYVTSPDTKGCPAGFAGKFRFSARLTNRSTTPRLEHLMVQVTTLTNGNLVQNAEGGPAGVGAHVLVRRSQGYTDGVLAPKESVEVPFVICLKKRAPFRMLVDVLEDGGD